MLPLEPVLYYGCQNCDGLFSNPDLHAQHVIVCSGDRKLSDCQMFACPRDTFLRLCTKQQSGDQSRMVGSETDAARESHKEECSLSRQQQIPLDLQKCLSGPLKKVRVIGILKKNPSPVFTANRTDEVIILNQDGGKAHISERSEIKGVQNNEHLQSELNVSHFEETGMEPQQDQNEHCEVVSEENSDELKNQSLDNVGTADADEDLNCWEEVKTDDCTVFKCKHCSHESASVSFMKRHIQIHNNGKVMQCDRCDFTTMWKNHLRTHISKHEKPKFLCEQCPQEFRNRSSLTRHCAKKHNGQSNFSCKYTKECGFVAVNSVSLRDHIRKHTGELLFCDYDQCKFMTKFEKALALHKAKHQGKTRYICEVCGYRTIESGSFKRHTLTHTGKKLFKCPDCPYKASCRYVVVKHIYGKHINHKRYACNRCDFKTAYYSGLSMHLMAHEGIKPYKCSLCPYRSNLSNKVKRHCAQKHDKAEAKAIKVENCLKFDVRDYMNPEVSRVDVKVIRLTDSGGEEEEVHVEDGETKTSSTVLDTNITENNDLLHEAKIPSLPPESNDDLEDISMMEESFNLCSDPTFSLPQNFQSEDPDTVFTSRQNRLDSTSADDELSKVFDVQKTKVSFFDSPDTSLQSDLNSEELDNLGMRSESLENLTQIKSSCATGKSDNINIVYQLSSTLDHQAAENTDVKSLLPVMSSSPFLKILTLPLVTAPPPHSQTATQNASSPKQLKSLLSPNVLKAMSERNLQLTDQVAVSEKSGKVMTSEEV